MNALLRHSGAGLSAALAALPAALGLLLKPAWREGLGERLGMRGPDTPGAIWVHGASVGEILAAARLLDALSARGLPVCASTMTLSGRAVIETARPNVPRVLSPLEHPWCVDAALSRVDPQALIFVETEVWPMWISGAWRRGVPTGVVSGRISDKSLPVYERLRPVLRSTFAKLWAVGARGEEDAARFVRLGVPEDRVWVTGDLKLEPPVEPPDPAPDLAAVIGKCAPWIAASTHAGEETAVLDALDQVEAAGARVSLIIAPRHLDRVDSVASEIERRSRRLRRRSALRSGGSRADRGPLEPGEVLLIDTLGEVPGLLALACCVFVGGTLAPIGGHNVLEPALVGRPVLFGPHTENVRQAADRLLSWGGGIRVEDAAGLADALVGLLREPDEADRRGERARRKLERHKGATVRCVAMIEQLIELSNEARR